MSTFEVVAAWASIGGLLFAIWAVVAARGARSAAQAARDELRGQWLVHPSIAGLREHLEKCYDAATDQRWESVQTVVGYAIADIAFMREYYAEQLSADDQKGLSDILTVMEKCDKLSRRKTQQEAGELLSLEKQELQQIPEKLRDTQKIASGLAGKLQRRQENSHDQ